MAKSPPTTANDVANWFLNRVDREAGDIITPLALQKLVFFAQAWFLANRGKPLFKEDFQAWAHGPVVRSLWERFRDYQWDALPSADAQPELSAETQSLLDAVYDKYGQYSAKKLERMTHEKKGPWEKARNGLSPEARCETIISKQAIRDFYGAKIGKTWEAVL